MDITCLVRHKQSNKTVAVGGLHQLDDVKLALQRSEHYKHLDPHNLLIQVFDDRFQDYVDLDNTTVLKEFSKLNIITLETPLDAVVVSEATAGPFQFLSFEPEELFCQSTGKDPARYRLPQMPIHIEDSLKRVAQLGDVTESVKRQIVDHLYFDLCNYTIYPGRLYTEAAEQLVAKYPALKDGSKTTYDVWRGHLRVKAKNKRRSMQGSVPGVSEARERNEKAKEAKRNGVAGSSLRHIARHMNGVTWGNSEDEDSLAGHMAFMAKEVHKTNPDWMKVAISMECTFNERRRWMTSTQPLVADIVAKYPALGYVQAIHQEFHLLTKHDVAMDLKAALQKCGPRLINLAERKRRGKAAVDDLKQRLDAVAEVETDGCFATSILLLLPLLLKENASCFLQKLVGMNACIIY